jgi:NADH:ubiquinone oxidoreductase subunit B-like Fe-S oxidoreductase
MAIIIDVSMFIPGCLPLAAFYALNYLLEQINFALTVRAFANLLLQTSQV